MVKIINNISLLWVRGGHEFNNFVCHQAQQLSYILNSIYYKQVFVEENVLPQTKAVIVHLFYSIESYFFSLYKTNGFYCWWVF